MENIINELYCGNICPVEKMGRVTTKAILKRVHESEGKLEKAVLHSIQSSCRRARPRSGGTLPSPLIAGGD